MAEGNELPLSGWVPDICVRREWEKTGDTSVLNDGITARQTGMSGATVHNIGCLSCGVELRFDLTTHELKGPECPRGEPESGMKNLYADSRQAEQE